MKSTKYTVILVLFFFFGYHIALSQNAEHILETNKPALVSIWGFQEAYYNEIREVYAFDTLVLWGSGFIINEEGEVCTCYHLVSNIDSILVKTSEGLFFPVSVISIDTVNDLALLKIQHSEDKLFPYVALGNSDELTTGETIYAVGNPLGYEYSISQGIISGIRDDDREHFGGKEVIFDRVIQTDAAVSPGSSGGAFFNIKGEVIGITSYFYPSMGNLNFGVAINSFKKLIDNNSILSVVLNLSKEKIKRKIESCLETANFLKREIKSYSIHNDSCRNSCQSKPSLSLGDSSKVNGSIDLDSLNKLYQNKAEYLYLKCLMLDSTFFDIYDDLTDYYLKIKKPEKAEEIYLKAKRVFKDNPDLQYLTSTLETYYFNLGKIDKIKKLYGIENGDKDIKAVMFYKLGCIYSEVGDSVNSNKQYLKAIDKDPKYYKAYFQLGKYFFKRGNYSKAKKYLESAYEYMIMPVNNRREEKSRFSQETYSDFELHYYLGMISVKEGNKSAALIYYLQLKPLTEDESEKAIGLYKKIVR